MKDFDVNDGGEWFFVYLGVVININFGLMVEVMINIERICYNMINKEFWEMVLSKCD